MGNNGYLLPECGLCKPRQKDVLNCRLLRFGRPHQYGTNTFELRIKVVSCARLVTVVMDGFDKVK
jgi:hypothetical protein